MEKPIKFKTLTQADEAMLDYIDQTFDNKFQDAHSIARIQVRAFGGLMPDMRELPHYYCIQFGDYGPYLTK